MSETLLRGGLILDGSGRPGQSGDVLISGKRIVDVGQRISAPGARVIDVDGLAVAPGFIDMHAHSDLVVMSDPWHVAKVSQGITTEVVGQDGLSYAPVTDITMALVRDQIMGWNGAPPGVEYQWRSVEEYLNELDRADLAANVAYLLPQGTIRLNIVGEQDRRATPRELRLMCDQVRQGMRAGAFGMSSGLTYVPGMFARTDELVALCRVVHQHGGFYAPHHRSYGADALEAYDEMIDVARSSGCPLHLTHATMNFDVNRNRAPALIDLIDRGLADGVDISFDSYPYLAGSTTLSALLPAWVVAGGVEAAMTRLRSDDERARIVHDLDEVGTPGSHGVPLDWESVEIAGVQHPDFGSYVGHTIADIARKLQQRAAEVALDVMIADRLRTTILQHVGDESNVRTMMRHPRHMGGSDGILVGEKPHPRAWGTFPRYLGRYVRDEGVLTLEDAIVHLSARPAARLGLTDRGRILPGRIADVVVFDPANIRDRATYESPRQRAAGIAYVFVGGETVMELGERTHRTPGVTLRGSRSRG